MDEAERRQGGAAEDGKQKAAAEGEEAPQIPPQHEGDSRTAPTDASPPRPFATLSASSRCIEDARWVPDNPDGSGWAEVDWVSAARGSRYHYRHGEPHAEAQAALPPFYRVVTRLDTELLHAPHENSYYVPRAQLADFLAELTLAGGVETIWHIEPCSDPPPESRVR